MSRLLQFSKCFNVAQSWWKCNLSVKQLGSGWDAELLGVSSGSKLFAFDTIVVSVGLRVDIKYILLFLFLFCYHFLQTDDGFNGSPTSRLDNFSALMARQRITGSVNPAFFNDEDDDDSVENDADCRSESDTDVDLSDRSEPSSTG